MYSAIELHMCYDCRCCSHDVSVAAVDEELSPMLPVGGHGGDNAWRHTHQGQGVNNTGDCEHDGKAFVGGGAVAFADGGDTSAVSAHVQHTHLPA